MSKLDDVKPIMYNYKYTRYEPYDVAAAEQYISQHALIQNIFQVVKAVSGPEEALLYCLNRQIDHGIGINTSYDK